MLPTGRPIRNLSDYHLRHRLQPNNPEKMPGIVLFRRAVTQTTHSLMGNPLMRKVGESLCHPDRDGKPVRRDAYD